jgi:hypothetical protein
MEIEPAASAWPNRRVAREKRPDANEMPARRRAYFRQEIQTPGRQRNRVTHTGRAIAWGNLNMGCGRTVMDDRAAGWPLLASAVLENRDALRCSLPSNPLGRARFRGARNFRPGGGEMPGSIPVSHYLQMTCDSESLAPSGTDVEQQLQIAAPLGLRQA